MSVAVQLLFGFHELHPTEEADVVHHVGQNALHERAVVPDGGDADLGRLPHVLLLRLRDRDVEFVGERILEALEDATLVFQGVRVPQHESNLERPDDHEKKAPGRLLLLLELSRDLLDGEGLDDVPLSHVVVAGDLDAALVALLHLLHVVLEALQALELSRVDDLAVTDEAHLTRPLEFPVDHHAARDRAHARDPKDLLHARLPLLLLDELGLEEALERGLHLLDRLIDHRVELDLDPAVLRHLGRARIDVDVDPDDDPPAAEMAKDRGVEIKLYT